MLQIFLRTGRCVEVHVEVDNSIGADLVGRTDSYIERYLHKSLGRIIKTTYDNVSLRYDISPRQVLGLVVSVPI